MQNKNDLKDLKIAITHDYLVEYGGAETVLLELLKLFPQADLYAALYYKDKKQREVQVELSKHKVHTGFANQIPFKKKLWKLFLPLHIRFFRSLDFSEYDLVISSSAGFAKFINAKKPTKHIAYIHTPPRFLWGFETSFFHKIPGFVRIFLKPTLNKWKKLDLYYAREADLLVTNSHNIGEKIQACYSTSSKIVYPPVNIELIRKSPEETKQNFYILVSRLYNYKKIDVVIRAFNKNQHKLIILGDGPERKNLESLSNSNIEFKGFVDDNMKIKLLKQAKAFLFAAEEDFGIVMVEALAAGTPVVAYAKGGALEIVQQGKNGVLFDEQEPDSINASLKKLEGMNTNKNEIVRTADKFSSRTFAKEITALVSSTI